MSKFIDLTGQIFNRLKVLSRNFDNTNTIYWNCICECGNTTVVNSCNLKTGSVKSCGCLQKEKILLAVTKHGETGTPVYNVWKSIKQRTNNDNSSDYLDYGGRGITMCESWKNSFENFQNDMGPRPSSKHSVERQNNNGNYEPNNCYWATTKEQASNKSNNIIKEYNGEKLTAKEISNRANVNYNALRKRLNKGQDVNEAILAIKSHAKYKN